MVLSKETLSILKVVHKPYPVSIDKDNKSSLPKESDIIKAGVDLEIRESTIKGAGDGLFTRSKINKGDVILCISDADNIHSTHISKKINDLAYNGDMELYENDEHVLKNINLGYIIHADAFALMFGCGQMMVYMYALRDIEAGEELSRYYGIEFWNGSRKHI
jgi:hypothetical protein